MARRSLNQELAYFAALGDVEGVRRTCLLGADPNRGQALSAAARRPSLEVAEELFRHGAEVTRSDLAAAAGSGDPLLIHCLFDHGADPRKGARALRAALNNDDTACLKALAERGVNLEESWEDKDDDWRNGPWTSLLEEAVRKGAKATRCILEAGARPDDDAILLAVADDLECLRLLVAYGGDIKKFGGRALYHAADGRNPAAFVELLRLGADPGPVCEQYEKCGAMLAFAQAILSDRFESVEQTINDRFADGVMDAAIVAGAEKVVSALLEKNVPPQLENLLTAVRFGTPAIAELLISSCSRIPDIQKVGGSTLVEAAFSGSLDLVEALVEAGVDPNYDNKYGRDRSIRYALVTAVSEERRAVVSFLAPLLAETQGKEALTVALKRLDFESALELRRHGAELTLEDFCTTLSAANWTEAECSALCQHGPSLFPKWDPNLLLDLGVDAANAALIRVAVKNGADPNLKRGESLSTPLKRAVGSAPTYILETLLACGAIVEDHDGESLLFSLTPPFKYELPWHLPELRNSLAMLHAEKLVRAGADPNAVDKEGYSILVRAAFSGLGLFARILVELGAEFPKFSPEDLRSMEQALLVAVALQNIGAVHSFVDQGVSVCRPNSTSLTPLCFAALDGNSDMIRSLSGCGAKPEEEHEALMLAAIEGELGAIETLVEVGAKINSLSADSSWPAILAAGRAHNWDAVQTLIELDAKVPPPSGAAAWDLLELAANDGQKELLPLIRYLQKRYPKEETADS